MESTKTNKKYNPKNIVSTITQIKNLIEAAAEQERIIVTKAEDGIIILGRNNNSRNNRSVPYELLLEFIRKSYPFSDENGHEKANISYTYLGKKYQIQIIIKGHKGSKLEFLSQ